MEIAANNIQNINNAKINKPLSQANQKRINNLPYDEFCFSKFYVDLKNDEFHNIDGVRKGKINGFDTVLKYSFDNNGGSYIEGKIGDSKINLKTDENDIMSGEINGKKFNIKSESDKKMYKRTIFGEELNEPPKYVNFIGEFDNKPFEIKIPGANIPNDNDTKNLLALLLDFSGMCPQIYKNKMVGVSWKNKLLEVDGEIRDKHEKNKKDNMDTLIKPLLLALVTSVLTTLLGKLDKSK